METGYADMVCDLLHWGHIEFLKTCKSYCDYLIVGVDNDDVAAARKRRPIIPFDKRIEVLKAIVYVDEVRDSLSENPAVMMRRLLSEGYKLKYWFHGSDWTDPRAVEYIESIGGQAVITPYVEGIRTTKIIQMILRRYCRSGSLADGINRRDQEDRAAAR